MDKKTEIFTKQIDWYNKQKESLLFDGLIRLDIIDLPLESDSWDMYGYLIKNKHDLQCVKVIGNPYDTYTIDGRPFLILGSPIIKNEYKEGQTFIKSTLEYQFV